MLFSQVASTQCSFDPTVTCLKQLANIRPWDKDRGSADFGGWVECAPRKRKNRSKEHLSLELESKNREKLSSKLQASSNYYKRYRVDPLEGTFKHYKNIEQYMQLYRETTTLCFKQKTLNELTAMYSSALDINSDLKRQTVNGYTYNLDSEAVGKWDANCQLEEYLTHPLTIPPITSRSEGGIPLMLLPSAPSIPHRTHTNQPSVQSPIAQASFMCNAYMNKTIVCPVHRIIHRKSSLLINNGRVRSHLNEMNSTPDEHVKVTLPGIPRRRYNNQVKRLKALRDSHPIIGLQDCSKEVVAGSSSTPDSGNRSSSVRDEGEDEADQRINQLLTNAQSFTHADPCDRISKVLQQQQQQRRPVPSMQLPVTALLQYNPDGNSTPKPRHVKKPAILRNRSRGGLEGKKKSREKIKPKLEVKQLMNYEKEYERFFSDVLESKGRTSQKRHFQNMSSKT